MYVIPTLFSRRYKVVQSYCHCSNRLVSSLGTHLERSIHDFFTAPLMHYLCWVVCLTSMSREPSHTLSNAETLMAVLEVLQEQKVMLLRVIHHFYYMSARLTSVLSVFVCVAALAILDRLDVVDHDTLAWWLSERQLPNGGLNGRPEKLEDVCRLVAWPSKILTSSSLKVCYSFWVLSALSILNKVDWIDADKLTAFILSAQVCPSLSSKSPLGQYYSAGSRARRYRRSTGRHGRCVSHALWRCRSAGVD